VADGQRNESRTMLSYDKDMTAARELTIAIEDPSQPEIIALLRDGEEYSAKLYAAESNHHMPLGALRTANVFSSWSVT
jgi:hypothetical protein